MLLSRLPICKVKDLYHLPPLFLNFRYFWIPSFLTVAALQPVNLSKISLAFPFLKDLFSLSQKSVCNSSLPSYQDVFLMWLNCSALSQKFYSPFHWLQPVTLMEQIQFIYSNKDESALISFTCLLFLVALLSFRAIISPEWNCACNIHISIWNVDEKKISLINMLRNVILLTHFRVGADEFLKMLFVSFVLSPNHK